MNKKQRQSILCCRACLVTDCKMYDIHEHKAADAFAHITDTPVSRDRLPQQLCGWCLMLLHKYASFRKMCVRTQQWLTGMDSDGPQTPLRSFHLFKTDTIVINCIPPERNMIRPEPPEPDDVLMDDNINPDPKIKYEIEHTYEMENSFSINDINLNSKTQTETTLKENMGDENDDQFYSDGEDPLNNIEGTCNPSAEVLMDFIMEPVPKLELDYEEDKISIHENEIGYLLNLDDNKDVSNIKNNHQRNSCDDDEIDMNSVDAVDNNVNPEKEDESNNKKERISEGNKNKEDFKDSDKSHDNVNCVPEDNVCGKQAKRVKGRRKKEKVKKKWDGYAAFESANEVKVVVLSKLMMGQTREEVLAKKRERERLRYQRTKNNPELLSEYQRKNREKYEKRKQEKKVIPINEMSSRQQMIQRKKWRDERKRRYQRVKDKKAREKRFRDENNPHSSDYDHVPLDAPEEQQENIAVKKQKSKSKEKKNPKII